MANIKNKDEPSTAPKPDRWYNLTLGSSFKDHHPSSKFCTLRYEFKPASIDKNQPGTLIKNKDNKVTVEFHNNQPGKPKTAFEGIISDDTKENDAVLFFDGESFRLERLHRAVKRLKHLRLPGESASTAVGAVPASSSVSAGVAPESGSPPVGKGNKFQPFNKNPLPAVPVEVERIEIGDFKSSGSDANPSNEKVVDYPSARENVSNDSPDKTDDLEDQLDIMNDDDDDDDDGVANGGNIEVKEFHTEIGIDIPHQNDTDEEIADVDASDDEADKGPNAAEALRAQVNAEERGEQTSSSSSGSDSSEGGSRTASGSPSTSGSESGSSSNESDSSDADTVNSI